MNTKTSKSKPGRGGAREILITTPAISNLIRGQDLPGSVDHPDLETVGDGDAERRLLELVEKREISPDEAYMKSVEKAGLVASLKAKGHKLTIAA